MRLAITKGQTKKGGGRKPSMYVQKRGRKTALLRGITTEGGGEKMGGMRNIKKLLFLPVKCVGGHTIIRPLSLSLLQHCSLTLIVFQKSCAPIPPFSSPDFPSDMGGERRGGRVDDF